MSYMKLLCCQFIFNKLTSPNLYTIGFTTVNGVIICLYFFAIYKLVTAAKAQTRKENQQKARRMTRIKKNSLLSRIHSAPCQANIGFITGNFAKKYEDIPANDRSSVTEFCKHLEHFSEHSTGELDGGRHQNLHQTVYKKVASLVINREPSSKLACETGYCPTFSEKKMEASHFRFSTSIHTTTTTTTPFRDNAHSISNIIHHSRGASRRNSMFSMISTDSPSGDDTLDHFIDEEGETFRSVITRNPVNI